MELVNDAEPLIREALLYPLDATLASDAAKAFVEDGSVADVGKAVVDAFAAGELPDPSSADFAAEWKAWVKGAGKAMGRKGKGLFMPLRIVTTGRMAGPDIPAQLALLGLVSGEVQLESTPLAERVAALEKALSGLPAPAAAE